MKFGCFQSIDARQNIGIPINGIEPVAFCCGNEGEMNSNSFGPSIRAGKQAVFSHKNPTLNSPLGLVVVDCNIGIFEKSCQGSPVVERVANRLRQVVRRIEFVFSVDDDFSKKLYERFRFSAPDCQSERRRFVLYVPLDTVKISVYIKDRVSNIFFGELGFKVFATGMSAATGFDSLSIFIQRVESAGSICLNDAFEVLEEGDVFVKREVWREVEHVYRMLGVADVCGHFPFANIILVAAVLNFDGRVIGFDDAGLEQLKFLEIVEQGKSVCSGLHPVTLSGARNCDLVTGEHFPLTIIRKPVVKFADDYFTQQSRTGVTARNRRTGLFCCNDVLLAARAGSSFLEVIENLQAGAYYFELVGEKVTYEICVYRAIRTDYVFWIYRMLNGLMAEILSIFQNVFNTGGSSIARFSARSCFFLSLKSCRTGIVFFSFVSVVALIALFGLSNQDIELSLQVLEQFAQLFVAVQRLLELTLQVCVLLDKALNFFIQSRGFVTQEAPYVVASIYYHHFKPKAY